MPKAVEDEKPYAIVIVDWLLECLFEPACRSLRRTQATASSLLVRRQAHEFQTLQYQEISLSANFQ